MKPNPNQPKPQKQPSPAFPPPLLAFSPAALPANLLPSPNRQPRQAPRVRPTSRFPAANPAEAPWPSTLASFPGLLQLAPQAQQLARAPAYPASAHTPISPAPRDDAPQVHPPASPNARADATRPLLAWPHREPSAAEALFPATSAAAPLQTRPDPPI